MRLVAHIVGKDLRRMAWPLLLWGAVILMQYGVWHVRRTAGNGGDVRGMSDAVLLLWALHLVIGWLLVARLLEDDPLLAEQAAWRVRPISGGRLLAAKVGGMAVMLWLWPSLLTVPWWVEFGFGFGEIVRVVAVNMLGMAAWTGVALLVAVLTEGFARFIGWSLVVGAGAMLAGLTLAVGLPVDGEGAVDPAVVLTRGTLAAGVVAAVVAVVVPLQFLARRTRLAYGVAIGGVLVVGLIVQAWPWSGAELAAKWGGRSLPTAAARIGHGSLVIPTESAQPRATVRMESAFEVRGLATGDLLAWDHADPVWRFGERRVASAGRVPLYDRWQMQEVATALVRGVAVKSATEQRREWEMNLSSLLAPALRNGEAVVGVTYTGTVWRGELGPEVPLRVGASASRGLEHIHVNTFSPASETSDRWSSGSVGWWQTGPLFQPRAILELFNPDGIAGRHRIRGAVVLNAKNAMWDERLVGERNSAGKDFLRGRIPVGLIGVAGLSSFDRRWWGDTETDELLRVGSRLATVRFDVAAPARVVQAETAFVADFVVEARLDEALRRAKAEGKRVFARVRGGETERDGRMPTWWFDATVRELLAKNFVCVQVMGEEAGRMRKKTDEPGAAFVAVLNANGEEQDRLRDLGGENLRMALQANLDGKTYAEVLMAALAARGGDDRDLRFRLHTALRARGELGGALDAIMWMVDHPRDVAEAREAFEVGQRLQRFVAAYEPARAALLERRERAVMNLRQDAGDIGAARLLFVITLGLRHDEAIWREFPRLMPVDNPSRWSYLRHWIGTTVNRRRYREVTDLVELEKFYAEGPAWVRAQLVARRSWLADGQPAGVGEWQQQLVQTGLRCVEALVGTGQDEAALRVASAVLRVNSAPATRELIAGAMTRGGAKAELLGRWRTTEGIYGR